MFPEHHTQKGMERSSDAAFISIQSARLLETWDSLCWQSMLLHCGSVTVTRHQQLPEAKGNWQRALLPSTHGIQSAQLRTGDASPVSPRLQLLKPEAQKWVGGWAWSKRASHFSVFTQVLYTSVPQLTPDHMGWLHPTPQPGVESGQTATATRFRRSPTKENLD